MAKKNKYEHSNNAKITDGSGPTEVCIFINNIPHIKFLKKQYVGLISWYESKDDFRIKIYLKDCTIKTEYNSSEKWKSVLGIINSQV